MKTLDVVSIIRANLPNNTDVVTTNFGVLAASFTVVSGTEVEVTIQTDEDHNLAVNKAVFTFGSKTAIAITSFTRVDDVGTIITDTPHDLDFMAGRTYNAFTKINTSGATEAEFNGTFQLSEIPNRNEITVIIADSGATSATGTPILLDGSSALQSANGLYNVSAVPTSDTFTYTIDNGVDFPTVTDFKGTIEVRSRPLVSGAATFERAAKCYTKTAANKVWLFAVVGDVSASKDRKILSDLTANNQAQGYYRQQVSEPLDIYAFIPSSDDLSGRAAMDTAQDLVKPLFQSVLGVKFDTGLTVSGQNILQFSAHGEQDYNTAFYVHQYSFFLPADIYFGDTIGYDEDVAFRDIALAQKIDFGTQEDSFDTDIDLDEDVAL